MVLFVGCKDVQFVQPFNANEPTVLDGRLDFETQEAFTNYINSIIDLDDDDLELKLRRFSEFNSLRPFFDETNTDKILVWATAKKERIEKQRKRISSSNGRNNLPALPCAMIRMSNSINDLEIDSEDELIKDPAFAALLNEKREISVAGKAYKYTYEGTYITDKDNIDAVYNYIENTDYSEIAQLPSGTNNIGNGMRLIRPIDDCRRGGSTGGGSTGGGSTGGGVADCQLPLLPCDYSETLPLCTKQQSSIMTNLFGPRTKCTDYFDSKNRIKTVAWSQEYVLWTSMGVKVVSQKKVMGVWWRSKVDVLELGYNYIVIDYPVIPFQWPGLSYDSYYETNDRYYNQYGTWIPSKDLFPIDIFKSWPIKNIGSIDINVYLKTPFGFPPIEKNIDGSDINSFVRDQLKSAISMLGSNFKSPDPNKMPTSLIAGLEDLGDSQAQPRFIYSDIKFRGYNTNSIVKPLEITTAKISFGYTFGKKLPELKDIKPTSKNYKGVKMDFYGMGEKNSVWKGSRVEFEAN